MSTFKVQPVYAELVLGWLDATHGEMAKFTVDDVLLSTKWRFRGGTLGEYPMRFATDSSGTSFPDGLTEDIAMEDDSGINRRALMEMLARRRNDSRRTLRSHADWTYSFLYCREAIIEHRRDVGEDSRISTGIHAVYIAARRLWEDAREISPGTHWRDMLAYMRESVVCSAAASLLHVPDAVDAHTRAANCLTKSVVPGAMHILRSLDQLMKACNSQEARSRARCAGRAALHARDTLNMHEDYHAPRCPVGRMVFDVLHGCAVCVTGIYVIALSRSDIVRLRQFFTGAVSGAVATVCQAAVAPGIERGKLSTLCEAYDRQVSRLLESSERVPVGHEVQVCKGFKRAFTYYLGTLAGPLSTVEAEELWAETMSTEYIAPEALTGWVNECRGWSAGTAFNIGKLYKLCPAPDASPAMTLLERHKMVTNHNVATDEALHAFETTLRDQILRAYIRKPGVRLELRAGKMAPTWWASYRAHRFDEVPSSSIHEHLAWEGTAEMPSRLRDDPAVWKDSGLGWDNFDEAVNPDRPRGNGNMLVRMLTDSSAPMPGVAHMRGPHHHKIDTKPEGHKDPARGIYSGNLADRLDQSWMEAAVESVATKHPSYMIGADTAAREERIRTIVDRTMRHDLVDVFYSFDVAGWSPRMDPRIQEVSHSIWAALFDSDLFRSAGAINNGARIYMNKSGFTGWFINPGANLEGYNGKEMTMVLVALMAQAVAVWRRQIVEDNLCTRAEASRWAAVLLAYIDDGLAKLTLPRERAEALFMAFQKCTVKSFADCGFTVEISKCFPSDRFAIFLNEPYLGGRHVVHGTRAAMTICSESTEQHTSLLERVTSVSTGCRGAVMSGLDALAGTMLQAYHVFSHIWEWVHLAQPVASAVWSFAPRSWGGLGLPTALQLGTSGGGAAAEEGVQTLQKWGSIAAPCRNFFLACARSPLKTRTAMGTLVSPLGGQLTNGPMVESRVPDAVRAGLTALLRTGRLSVLARAFLKYSSAPAMEAFSERVLPDGKPHVVQEQLLLDLASTHPHHLFSAFSRRVEKSSTLMSLVGPREMRRICRENRKDAMASYRLMKVRCLAL